MKSPTVPKFDPVSVTLVDVPLETNMPVCVVKMDGDVLRNTQNPASIAGAAGGNDHAMLI
jgi:hypothetical protein